MSVTALGLILIAALAHASWNLLSKQASAAAGTLYIWLVAAVAAVAYAPVVAGSVLLQHPHLTAMNWLFMAGTGVLEAAYFQFLQAGYRLGDLSVVYPVGRGTGALLAALAGITLLAERPGPAGIAGIVAIVAGITLIGLPAGGRPAAPRAAAAPGRARPRLAAAVALALATGTFIASYTLWDKYAVATLGTPAVLQGYATFPVMLAAFAPYALRRRAQLAAVWRSYRPQVIGTGLLTPLAYMLVLAALSFTAVSAVAPVREVSVLFGVVLGRRVLGEGGMARKLVAAAAIVAGIISIAFG
ncbi:MAG TPA: EamA family transporter [Streptosporangiaceae bacterium]|nr:EamA family transporter [Streptosporangiaceae bacterium]